MVKLHVKRDEESHFLYETVTSLELQTLIRELVFVYNGRLLIDRVCRELTELGSYGLCKPSLSPESDNLPDNELAKLELKKYLPKDGFVENVDPNGKRNGQAPKSHMVDVIKKVIAEAKSIISSESVIADLCLTDAKINLVLEMLSGALSVVYPLGIPDYELTWIFLNKFKNNPNKMQEIEGFLDGESTEIWWTGKELLRGKKLSDYIGKNEKTKMIIKLQKRGYGAPRRERAVSEEERRQMMLHCFRRQEELKRLEEDDNDSYLNSQWADKQELHKNFHGVETITWKPR